MFITILLINNKLNIDHNIVLGGFFSLTIFSGFFKKRDFGNLQKLMLPLIK